MKLDFYPNGRIVRTRPIGQSGKNAKKDLKNFGGMIYLPKAFIGMKIMEIVFKDEKKDE